MLDVIVLLLMVLPVLGALPIHAHSRDWGYYPTGIIAAILLVVRAGACASQLAVLLA